MLDLCVKIVYNGYMVIGTNDIDRHFENELNARLDRLGDEADKKVVFLCTLAKKHFVNYALTVSKLTFYQYHKSLIHNDYFRGMVNIALTYSNDKLEYLALCRSGVYGDNLKNNHSNINVDSLVKVLKMRRSHESYRQITEYSRRRKTDKTESVSPTGGKAELQGDTHPVIEEAE